MSSILSKTMFNAGQNSIELAKQSVTARVPMPDLPQGVSAYVTTLGSKDVIELMPGIEGKSATYFEEREKVRKGIRSLFHACYEWWHELSPELEHMHTKNVTIVRTETQELLEQLMGELPENMQVQRIDDLTHMIRMNINDLQTYLQKPNQKSNTQQHPAAIPDRCIEEWQNAGALVIHIGDMREYWFPETNGDNWIVFTPHDNEFSLSASNHFALVPATIDRYRKHIPGFLEKLRSRFGYERKPVEAPEETYPIYRNLRNTLEEEVFFRTDSSKKCLIFVPRETQNKASMKSEASALYPHSALLEHGPITALIPSDGGPVTFKQNLLDQIGNFRFRHTGQKKEMTPGKEQQITPLLTREMRALLEQCGEIVYENDASDTDRLLICFKEFHGFPGTGIMLNQFKKGCNDMLNRHRESISHAILRAAAFTNPQDVRFFHESMPLCIDINDERAAELIHNSWLLHEHAFQPLMNPPLFNDPRLNEKIRQLVRYCALDSREMILANTKARGWGACNFGDGRDFFEEEKKHHRKTISDLRTLEGAAADVAKLMKNEEALVFNKPQHNLIAQISQVLQTGDTGFLSYGGSHFHAGTTEKKHVEKFEDLFPFLPKTHILVIEEHEYAELLGITNAYLEVTSMLDSIMETPGIKRLKHTLLKAEKLLHQFAFECSATFINLINTKNDKERKVAQKILEAQCRRLVEIEGSLKQQIRALYTAADQKQRGHRV